LLNSDVAAGLWCQAENQNPGLKPEFEGSVPKDVHGVISWLWRRQNQWPSCCPACRSFAAGQKWRSLQASQSLQTLAGSAPSAPHFAPSSFSKAGINKLKPTFEWQVWRFDASAGAS